MKIEEITKSKDQVLKEDIEQNNDSCYSNEDVFTIVKLSESTDAWTKEHTLEEALALIDEVSQAHGG